MSASKTVEKTSVAENGNKTDNSAINDVSDNQAADKSTEIPDDENKTSDTDTGEDATQIIEQQAAGVFRAFLYEAEYDMARKLAVSGGKSSPPPPDDDDPNAHLREVARALREIGERLDNDPKFQEIVHALQTEAVGSRNIFIFMQIMKQFIDILKRSVNFPINLIKVSFQTLVAIWLNPYVLAEVGGTSDKRAAGDVTDSAKLIMQELEERAIKTYLKALMNETETARHIRLMVIGMFAAGKTSLVQNLLSLDNVNVESTDGIDIHINECFINEQDDWLFQESCFAEITDYKHRVAAMMNKSKTFEKPVKSPGVAEVNNEKAKDALEGNRVSKQSSVSEEAFMKTKSVLGTFRESDPILDSFLKDLYEAWIITETKTKGEKIGEKSSTQATVSIWDFAGQDVYYSTHHFFMNPASIYLLTMDINIPLESKLSESTTKSQFTHFHTGATYLDAFRFWLNSVHTYSMKYDEKSPTVILVGTHIDQLNGTTEERIQQGEDYFDEALKSFMNSPVLQHVHPKKFFVNNTNPDEDFSALRKEILELARKHKSWNQVVPARWILLERSLEQLRSEGREMVTVSELMGKDAENEYAVGNTTEMKEFLKFHHSLGNVLYFDTKSLENYVILSPQWIVDAFRCFVTSFPKKDPADLKLWDDYEKLAKLSPTLLHTIINNNQCLTDYKDEVVKYMEHLDIMAQPIVYLTDKVKFETDNNRDEKVATNDVHDENENTLKKPVDKNVPGGDEVKVKKVVDGAQITDANKNLETEKLDFHIVPSILSHKPSEELLQQVLNPAQGLKTSILCFVFEGDFLPPAIFHRLVAVCINRWPVSMRQKQFLLFRGLAVFNLTPSMELIIWMHNHVIFCRVVFYTIMGKGIPSELCQEARKFIKDTLKGLLGIYKDRWLTGVLPFEEYIHCDQAEDPLSGLMAVNDLMDGEVVCKAHSAAHVVKSSDALAHWYGDAHKEIKQNLAVNVDLAKVPTEKDLSRLADKIGHEYFRLGLELGVRSATIKHCQENHKFDLATIIFSVLKKWKEREGKFATLDKLKVAMENVDCDMAGFYEVFAKHPHSKS